MYRFPYRKLKLLSGTSLCACIRAGPPASWHGPDSAQHPCKRTNTVGARGSSTGRESPVSCCFQRCLGFKWLENLHLLSMKWDLHARAITRIPVSYKDSSQVPGSKCWKCRTGHDGLHTPFVGPNSPTLVIIPVTTPEMTLVQWIPWMHEI